MIGGAASVFVERVDIDGRRQTKALGIGRVAAFGDLAQGVGRSAILGPGCGPTARRSQGFAAGDGGKADLARADTICRFVEQANGGVAVRGFGLVGDPGRSADVARQRLAQITKLAKAYLVNDGEGLDAGENIPPCVSLRRAQGRGHQAKGIQRGEGIFFPIIDLADADDDGNAVFADAHPLVSPGTPFLSERS